MATGVHYLSEAGQTPVANNVTAPSHDTPTQQFKLGGFAIDEYRPLRIIVIGAGYSGIIAGIRLQQRMKNVDFVIYEKMAGVGGTW